MKHPQVESWVADVAAHLRPDSIEWCDGTPGEADALRTRLVADGQAIALDADVHPRSILHRSHPSDVARREDLSFICTHKKEDAGPTNQWMKPADARATVWPLFDGAMRGRTMFVVPYLMGPPGSAYSRVGVQLTDSAYVALSLGSMTRMGEPALFALSGKEGFVRGIHSLGDRSPERRYVMHFPQQRTIWSIGSGYGKNAILSKKCHALRIASVEGYEQGWLAEHMMIIGVRAPDGEKHYIAAAFPSGCGKTNLAMLVSKMRGWTIETIGDDIAWLHVGDDGRLWAINPEAGFFGVAPGTSERTNPNAMSALAHRAIFTNVALRANGRVWWEGLSPLDADEVLMDWRGEPWRPGSDTTAAHPNSRFTVLATQCPSVGRDFFDPRGVPISAIVFGGRRARLAPLIYEARDWAHGVYLGATLVSETNGVPRHDPMAMLPFCGYNMGDYFGHWLSIGRRLRRPPRIFAVNWFRTAADGSYLWPGFGENLRVLRWIAERVTKRAGARETAIGFVPHDSSFDSSGLDLSAEKRDALFAIDPRAWLAQVEANGVFFDRFDSRLPASLADEHRAVRARLQSSFS